MITTPRERGRSDCAADPAGHVRTMEHDLQWITIDAVEELFIQFAWEAYDHGRLVNFLPGDLVRAEAFQDLAAEVLDNWLWCIEEGEAGPFGYWWCNSCNERAVIPV